MAPGIALHSVLIANRGEIALRIVRTLRRLGIRSILVFHDIDRTTPAVAAADETIMLSGTTPVAAYLDGAQIIAAAKTSGAQAIHPGYGFLSENAHFARSVAETGLIFVGPAAETIDLMGDKIRARAFVAERGFPVAPSAIEDDDPGTFSARVRTLGCPLLLKPSAGGGGKGMRIVRDLTALDENLARARGEAQRYFGDPRLYAERYVERPRHIEVQVLGDAHGHLVHLFERECSIQRRFQKIIEEAPSPALNAAQRTAICETAAGIARAAGYRNAGTIEFILGQNGEFYFLEMNTRLQVEHPVTEMATGLDLVEEQLRVAAGEPLRLRQEDIRLSGHAIEARLYAEAPARDFAPTSGKALLLHWPQGDGVRVDAGVAQGQAITTAFDPMLAKIIAHGEDRAQAIATLRTALRETILLGCETNANFLGNILAARNFADGNLHTGFLDDHPALATDEAPSSDHLTALLAVAALSNRNVIDAADAVPMPHAAMGAWRN